MYAGGTGVGESSRIAWFDRTGTQLGPVVAEGKVWDPAISPDEKSVAFRRRTSNSELDIWLRDLTRGTETRFTSNAYFNLLPFWAPGGDRIAYTSGRSGGGYNLFLKAASGSGQAQPLLKAGNLRSISQWSRDGRFIVYTESDPQTFEDLWVLPMQGTAIDGGNERTPVPFLRTEFSEQEGQLSPDSHWMAYASNQAVRREIYVRPFPPAEEQWTVSVAGGEMPRWRGDGR